MNQIIEPEDVFAVCNSFLDINRGDNATQEIILAICSELLDVSTDALCSMIIDKFGGDIPNDDM